MRVTNKIITVYSFFQDTRSAKLNEMHMDWIFKLALTVVAELCQTVVAELCQSVLVR